MAATLGHRISGVQVATTTRSRLAASIPAQARARRAASSARSVVSTCDSWRFRIPVRSMIHSSLVSMSRSRSALDSDTGGTHLPHPVISARVCTARFLPRCPSEGILTIRGWPAGRF